MDEKRPTLPSRTLKIDIISIFIVLFILAFGLVIWYISHESSQSIHAFARTEIARVSDVIEEKSQNFEEDTTISINIVSKVFSQYETFSVVDPRVKDYLMYILKYDKEISNIYVSDMDGNSATVYTLRLTTENHFLSQPEKRLPESAAFAFELSLNNPAPRRDIVYYYDKELNVVAKENVKPYYDSRTREWFKNALKTKGIYWTEVYRFIPSHEYGITASVAFDNPNGAPRGVVGADLSFILLSEFIDRQHIGNTGSTFLYDTKADFLLPRHKNPDVQRNNELLVKNALTHKRMDDGIHHIVGEDGEDYLLYTSKTTLFGSKDWKTVVIVGVHHYFKSLFKMQRNILIFIVVMLIISTTLVIIFARRISKPITVLSKEIDRVRALDLDSDVRVKSRVKEIFLMDEAIFKLRNAVRSFTRYVPKEVVKTLLNQDRDIVLGSESRELTVMFTDIVGFTTISEKLPTEELTELLEEYFSEMTAIILRYDGTIDKYIGDSVMAFWGAPEDVENRDAKACEAALECLAFIDRLNQKRESEGKPLFQTRFGLHTGQSIVGNVGTRDRMNYTAIGDPINTASRLEGINKEYGSTIAISDALYEKVGGDYLCRPLDRVAVKGREQETVIYELIAKKDQATGEQRELCEAFAEALEAHRRGDNGPLKSLAQRFPNDGPTNHYLTK